MLKLKLQSFGPWCEEPTHWNRPWCWERLKAGGEGDDRGWDGWKASLTQWTWVWASSGSWWWTRKPGVLQSIGPQGVRHDWATELNRMGKTRDLLKKIEDIKGTFHARMGMIKDRSRNSKDLKKAEKIKKRWKNIPKSCTKKVLMTWTTTMVWSLTSIQNPGVWRIVSLRKHYYEQSKWTWWNSSWAISNPKRWCC